VEPTYDKKLETLEELLDADVVYGYHPVLSFFQDTVDSPELVKFLELKTLKEDCGHLRKCVERMITKRDISSISAPFFATYVAMEMGTVDFGKIICSLVEGFLSAGATVLFKKGNPLLDTFNTLMRLYLEAGLLERHWTELQHRASLMGKGRFTEAAGDKFSSFSVSQLTLR
jgi:hypothetical protein